MKRKYYLVTPGGHSAVIIDEFTRLYKIADEQIVNISNKYGAKGYSQAGQQVVGLCFEQNPGIGWISRGSYFVPDKRTSIGKSIAKKLNQVMIPDVRYFSKMIGLGWVWADGKIGFASFITLGAHDVISIPVINIGEPFIPPDCTPLKMSEYYALKEKAEAEKEQPNP